jgi:DNA-directed RNA polymerase specialized sigma24 family protein
VACTDQELVDLCLQSDEEAWAALSDLIKRLVGSLSATRWLDAGAQEDVAQEVLAELLHDQCRALRRFAGRSRFSTYLATIVLRVAARLHRGPRPLVPSDPGLVEELSKVTDRKTLYVEMWAVIQQILSSTDVLILRLGAAGYTSDEIAGMLSRLDNRPWRAEAVRQRKSRAIRRVRQALSEDQ